MGTKNGWQGIIINGCIRDSEDIGKMSIGVKALGTHPLKSSKRDTGTTDSEQTFSGLRGGNHDAFPVKIKGITCSCKRVWLSRSLHVTAYC